MTRKHKRKQQRSAQSDETFSGLQLRAARRMAQRHGIAAATDRDAIRQLRARGFDPFERTVQLRLVGSDDRADDTQKVDAPGPPPPAPPTPAQTREAEINRIQTAMAKTRRRRLFGLVFRLLLFVALPGVLAAAYYARMATPLFATQAEFLILKNDGAGGGGGLLSGTQFATNQDAIAVQSYLLSREAMQRLDSELGFADQFDAATLDPVLSYWKGETTDDLHRLYKKMVRIGFDPSEGVLKMEVRAPDPKAAARFAGALIGYAEARVDALSQRKRDAALAEAEVGLDEAAEARRAAQRHLVSLQQASALADPAGRILSLRGQINGLEVQLQDKRLRLASLKSNLRPPQARVAAAQSEIAQIEALLAEVNAQMVSAADGAQSLAEIAVEVQVAEADLASRDLMLQAAIDRLDSARRDADAQARYLTVSVRPVAPDTARYPRIIQDTALVVLVAAGIYLMMSLTVSILREQVTT